MLTVEALRAAALRHLSRHAPSSAQLRAVLARRVQRAGQPELAGAVDGIVAEMVSRGFVDDTAWAAARARRLIRRGVAPGVARQRLRAHGVEAEAELAGEAELRAARALVRRRRLGPWRGEARGEHRSSDLAKLGRAGFGWAVAVRVIDEELDLVTAPEAAP